MAGNCLEAAAMWHKADIVAIRTANAVGFDANGMISEEALSDFDRIFLPFGGNAVLG
jgi:hypothetical protein